MESSRNWNLKAENESLLWAFLFEKKDREDKCEPGTTFQSRIYVYTYVLHPNFQRIFMHFTSSSWIPCEDMNNADTVIPYCKNNYHPNLTFHWLVCNLIDFLLTDNLCFAFYHLICCELISKWTHIHHF